MKETKNWLRNMENPNKLVIYLKYTLSVLMFLAGIWGFFFLLDLREASSWVYFPALIVWFVLEAAGIWLFVSTVTK